ncbi:LysM domain-containing protein [Hydrogenispora ethanolica]|jgi:LysM repeat protein|uniref:LysM domain-containing protein n=1 Tax=Hydrogenispora ethanolica TaxID=1082276 RepID=A0A4R1S9W5_HYDET|nr:LysM domain-containing protein [Hydrogenispora ethanolica]TCL76266.1 LysM domain-containing protein [Hydrogenispora ethanolica]
MSAEQRELVQYVIQPDDTLWDIADEHDTTVEEIMAVNPGLSPYNLQVGQTIWIDSSNLQQEQRYRRRFYPRRYRPYPYFRPYYYQPYPYQTYPYQPVYPYSWPYY